MREIALRDRDLSQYLILLLAILMFCINSCSSSLNTSYNLDYNHRTFSNYTKDSSDFKIVEFRDSRHTNPNVVLNYPDDIDEDYEIISINMPVTEFVENAFNKLFDQNNSNKAKKVIVIIDNLRFYNRTESMTRLRICDCSMRFIIDDGTGLSGIKIRKKIPVKIMQVKNNYVENQIYDAVKECLIEFNTKFKTSSKFIRINTQDEFSQGYEIQEDIDSTESSIMQQENLDYSQFVVPRLYDKSYAVTFNYNYGVKVENGYQLLFKIIHKSKESGLEYGYGAGVNYYDILNSRNYYAGHFFAIEFPFFINYNLFEDDVSNINIFLGASARLNSGNETIQSGRKKENSYFIGPVFEQYIGIKLLKTIMLDLGIYELAFAGSVLLPSDIGSRFGINFVF